MRESRSKKRSALFLYFSVLLGIFFLLSGGICVHANENQPGAMQASVYSAFKTNSIIEVSNEEPSIPSFFKTSTTTTDDTGTMVWIPKSGSKYHSKSTCSNMKNPTQVSLEDAKYLGYTACKKCVGSSSAKNSNTKNSKQETKTTTESSSTEEMVWIPKSGSKYHKKSSCSNMKNPTQVTKSKAVDLGYTACKKCAK